MKKHLTRYKIINLLLLLFVGIVTLVIYFFTTLGYCAEMCTFETRRGVINPLLAGGKVLVPILLLLLLLPSEIFRKWLWYIAPWSFALVIYFVLDISVHSSGLFSDRGIMASNGVQMIGWVTLAFVIGHFIYYRVIKKTK